VEFCEKTSRIAFGVPAKHIDLMLSATSIIISLLSGGISGSVTGALSAHFLTKRRDKANRKANFLGFLAGWETKIDFDRQTVHVINLPPGSHVIKTIEAVARDFIAKRVELNEKARLLEPNYRGKNLNRFQCLTKTVADMPLGEVDKDPKQLLRAIRDLADFVEQS
jgi:hypothetical protein